MMKTFLTLLWLADLAYIVYFTEKEKWKGEK